MAYMCGLCDGAERAVLLITPLSGADTMPVGQDCASLAYISLLAGNLNVDADKLYDHVMQLAGEGQLTPQPAPAPDGMVYKSGTGDLHSTDDLDGGLCGYVHDDWRHCHRAASHAGRHGKAKPRETETAQGPPAAPTGAAAPGGEVQ